MTKKENRSKIGCEKNGNTVQSSRVKHWFLTLNNYSEDDLIFLRNRMEKFCKSYVFQEELGKTTKTRHLQGYMELISKKRLTALKKWNKLIHWEAARNNDACEEYCNKLETRNGRCFWKNVIIRPKDPLNTVRLYDWQKNIMDMLKTEPDGRTINWYYDLKGNCGKTSLARHICLNYPALYIQGKANDIKYAIKNWNGQLHMAILGIPRTYEQFVSYDAIESILDGIMFSGKYESGMTIFDPPHVIVFANFKPDLSKCSKDRWNVVELGGTILPAVVSAPVTVDCVIKELIL